MADAALDTPELGLGLDAGGSTTRWALAAADGRVAARGEAAGLSGLQLASAEGREALRAAWSAITQAAGAHGAIGGVCAGLTGIDSDNAGELAQLVAAVHALPLAAIEVCSDIELACRAAFAPGEGVLLYAGTGTVAGFLGCDGRLQRAGGHGVLIDDAGGGYWIAVEALRRVWRAEDEAPGAWQGSALARRLFEAIGGSDWAATRRRVYAGTRGEVGLLALAVARAADDDGDAAAIDILQRAGRELARLARALAMRCGVNAVATAGRAFALSPHIEAALRAALPPAITLSAAPGAPELAAACRAARAAQAAHAAQARPWP